VVSGVTSAAKNGVLIKGGNHLEAMGEVNAVAVDKTGTLTKGELAVTDVIPVSDADEATLLPSRRRTGATQRASHRRRSSPAPTRRARPSCPNRRGSRV